MTMPTEEQVFSGWANGHRAHAAREAINAYWKAQLQPEELPAAAPEAIRARFMIASPA